MTAQHRRAHYRRAHYRRTQRRRAHCRGALRRAAWSLVALLVACGALGCGDSVTVSEDEWEPYAQKRLAHLSYDALPADDVGPCEPSEDPPEVWIADNVSFEPGYSCVVVTESPETGDTWATSCKETTCLCLANDVVQCGCETEGNWCGEPIPSCCPPPHP